MAAFEWSQGGEWNGKPWSAELPTDSALLFYLFAAYLAAPQWLFPQVRRFRAGRGAGAGEGGTELFAPLLRLVRPRPRPLQCNHPCCHACRATRRPSAA